MSENATLKNKVISAVTEFVDTLNIDERDALCVIDLNFRFRGGEPDNQVKEFSLNRSLIG